jgi:transcription elongation factor Elf1
MTGTYGIDCECDNCNYVGVASMKKGEKVPSTFECPKCGCNTAHKKNDYSKPIDDYDPWKYPYSPKKKPWDWGSEGMWKYVPPYNGNYPRVTMCDTELCNA